MKKLNVGLIGFGLSGKHFHTPLLLAHPGYQILKVNTSQTQEVQKTIPQAQVTQDPFDLIHDPNLDLIINCAPNTFHFSYTKAALESQKHVVVEKPFVNTSAEGQILIDLAEKNKKVLSVFQNRRWDSDFLTIKKLISENKLGTIQQFESHFDRWRPRHRAERWREQAALSGSGLFYDLGPHLIDQALTLFGQPDSITADICIQKKEAECDDYFHLILKYKSMRVILHSTSFSNSTPRFQIFGDQGNFIKYGLDSQEEQLKQGLSPLDDHFGCEVESQFGQLIDPEKMESTIISSEKGNYLKYYSDLHQHITTGKTANPVTPQSALQVIQLIELALQSSQLGKSMIIARP